MTHRLMGNLYSFLDHTHHNDLSLMQLIRNFQAESCEKREREVALMMQRHISVLSAASPDQPLSMEGFSISTRTRIQRVIKPAAKLSLLPQPIEEQPEHEPS